MRNLEVAALITAGVVVLGVLVGVTLIKLRDGRYARSLLARLGRVRFVRRRMMRAYVRDLEQTDPVAARAFWKLERLFGHTNFRHTRSSLSVLSHEERRAYLNLFDEPVEAANRAARRHARKDQRGRRA